jgi:adenosylhomocysteine nucleosidase
MRRILVVAAMNFEVRAMAEALGVGMASKGGTHVAQASRAGKGGEEEVVLIAAGPGFRAARTAFDAGLRKLGGSPDAVVSAGICGALAEDLELGDVVVASSVNGIECSQPECPRGRYRIGALVSQDRIAATVDERRRLASTGAIAVEMEAAAVLECARRIRVPVYGIKSVSDTADEEFALDLNAARREDGSFRISSILMQAARKPRSGFGELLRLKRRGEEAARTLGEFFANCHI